MSQLLNTLRKYPNHIKRIIAMTASIIGVLSYLGLYILFTSHTKAQNIVDSNTRKNQNQFQSASASASTPDPFILIKNSFLDIMNPIFNATMSGSIRTIDQSSEKENAAIKEERPQTGTIRYKDELPQ